VQRQALALGCKALYCFSSQFPRSPETRTSAEELPPVSAIYTDYFYVTRPAGRDERLRKEFLGFQGRHASHAGGADRPTEPGSITSPAASIPGTDVFVDQELTLM